MVSPNQRLFIDNIQLIRVDKVKFLGVIIDEHLTWKPHIDHVKSKHLYADDVQALIHGLPSDQIHLVERISCVSLDLHFWMKTNKLNLNP